MTRAANQDEINDHRRDLLKHDFDPPELTHAHRVAVAQLLGYCEGVCKSGILGEVAETQLRQHIARTLAAFNMPSRAERAGQ